ncbi:MAG: anti-sigma factor domain-containing protein [Bacillota bacterium]
MKAVVVDIKGKYAVALDKKGEFIKIRNNGKLNIGYEVDIPSKIIDFNVRAISKVASIAAVLILVLGVSLGAYGYYLPYSYVNVDINPSLEMTVNIYNRIIEVKGLNTDGEKLLSSGSLNNLELNEGIKSVLERAVEEGYLNEEAQNAVMITVSSKDSKKVSEIQEEVQTLAKQTLENDKVDSEVIIESTALDRRNEAKNIGISPGKLVLIEKLKEVSPETVVDEYKEKSVKEIVKTIKEKRKELKKSDDSDKDDTKEDSGNDALGKPSPKPEDDKGNKGDKEDKPDSKGNGEKDKDKVESKDVKDKGQDKKDNDKDNLTKNGKRPLNKPKETKVDSKASKGSNSSFEDREEAQIVDKEEVKEETGAEEVKEEDKEELKEIEEAKEVEEEAEEVKEDEEEEGVQKDIRENFIERYVPGRD